MSRVLILANEHVRQRMAGPAIRCFEFARELSALGHAVTLASPFPSDLPPQAFPVETYDASGLERLAARFDVVVMQGFVLDQCPGLRDAAQRLVVDLYDPFPLEELLISARAPMQARLEVQDKALFAMAVLRGQLNLEPEMPGVDKALLSNQLQMVSRVLGKSRSMELAAKTEKAKAEKEQRIAAEKARQEAAKQKQPQPQRVPAGR